MKEKLLYLLLALTGISCETEVKPDLDALMNILVVDAWLTNNDPIQHINITRSQPYFDASAPEKISDAVVTVTDLTDPSITYVFEERADRYTWESTDGNPLGIVGHEYKLTVLLDDAIYTSTTRLEDVPPLDSIRFRLEKGNTFFDDLIVAEFFASDLMGINNTYWIKAWKNGRFLGKPEEINIAYDAAFSIDENNDGVQFIQPIRDLITSSPYNLPDTLLFVNDSTLVYQRDNSIFGYLRYDHIIIDNDNFPNDVPSIPVNDDQLVSLDERGFFLKGDSVYVEIHSISNDAYFFLNQVIIETTRSGGFGALFDTPFENVSTNIIPENASNPVAGFFNISAVSGDGARLESEDQIRVLE